MYNTKLSKKSGIQQWSDKICFSTHQKKGYFHTIHSRTCHNLVVCTSSNLVHYTCVSSVSNVSFL